MEKSANIILSNTYMSGFLKVVQQIKQRALEDKFQSIILVVPDKFSLNAEQIFMENTGLSSVFNVWLTTLSRLVNKVVSNGAEGLPLLSKNSGTMLVSQIIQNNIDKISTYKKVAGNYSLAETMYNAINLLKSSGVLPDDLKQNFSNTSLGRKLQDIYLIYSEYEKQLKDKVDAITRLEIFNKKVANDQYVQNSEIYFAMFDSFTNAQINSLCKIAKSAKKFTIALCANTLQDNHLIFDNTVFAKIKERFEAEHINCKWQNVAQNGTKLQNFLATNLFSFKNANKLEADNVKLLQCDSTEQEVRYVASKIKYLVMEKGYLFDDINVAINGLQDYALVIKSVFDEYDLPFYVDCNRTLLDHYFSKTLLKIFDFVCGEKSTTTACAIANSPIFDIDNSAVCDFENYCKKYNIFGNELFDVFKEDESEQRNVAESVRSAVFDKIKAFEQDLSNCSCAGEYKQCIMQFLQDIDAKNMLQKVSQRQFDVVQKNIDMEVFDKFCSVLADGDKLLSSQAMDKRFYFDMLISAMNATNLLTVPLRCDAVFVGDASQSTFYPRKILFVCGATRERMPAYQADDGTITDTEIAVFKSSSKISPTIRELNKREKFKLFNLMTLPSDRLELTYATLIGGQIQNKSEFVTAIQNIILTNGKKIAVEKFSDQQYKLMNDAKKLPYFVGTMQNATKLASQSDGNLHAMLGAELAGELEAQKKQFLDGADRFNLTDARRKIFDKNKTTISQIEKYFRCPFMQFVDHAIRPKKNEICEVQAVDVGNILHKVAQLFVDNYIQNQHFPRNLDAEVHKIFDCVISSDKFKIFKKNKATISSLRAEAVRFCGAIKHQIECSDFVPQSTEKRFDGYNLQGGLSISGIVDRVDIAKDIGAVRIVDYKTGSDKFSFQNVYYGIKLQLVAYLKIVADMQNCKPVATMYMPVKNKFADILDDGFGSYKLDGIMLENDGVIKRMDKSLLQKNKSDVIPVSYNKDGSLSKNSQSRVLAEDQMQSVMQYAIDVIGKAVDEMLGGYIQPKPYKNSKVACQNCKYASLCHYSVKKSGYRQIKKKNKFDFGGER